MHTFIITQQLFIVSVLFLDRNQEKNMFEQHSFVPNIAIPYIISCCSHSDVNVSEAFFMYQATE
jgi:hypothetical protein